MIPTDRSASLDTGRIGASPPRREARSDGEDANFLDTLSEASAGEKNGPKDMTPGHTVRSPLALKATNLDGAGGEVEPASTGQATGTPMAELDGTGRDARQASVRRHGATSPPHSSRGLPTAESAAGGPQERSETDRRYAGTDADKPLPPDAFATDVQSPVGGERHASMPDNGIAALAAALQSPPGAAAATTPATADRVGLVTSGGARAARNPLAQVADALGAARRERGGAPELPDRDSMPQTLKATAPWGAQSPSAAMPRTAIQAAIGLSRELLQRSPDATGAAVEPDAALADPTAIAALRSELGPVTVKHQETHLGLSLRAPANGSAAPHAETDPGVAARAAPAAGLDVPAAAADLLALAETATARARTAERARSATVGDMPLGPVGAQVFDGVVTAASRDVAETQTAAPAAPVDGPRWQPISNPVRVLTIQLSPANLGPVTITLSGTDAALRIRVEADQATTAGQVERERDALTQRLIGTGLGVEEIVVLRADTATVAATPGAGAGAGGERDPSQRDRADGGGRGGFDTTRGGDGSSQGQGQSQSGREASDRHGMGSRGSAARLLPEVDERAGRPAAVANAGWYPSRRV